MVAELLNSFFGNFLFVTLHLINPLSKYSFIPSISPILKFRPVVVVLSVVIGYFGFAKRLGITSDHLFEGVLIFVIIFINAYTRKDRFI